MFNHFLAHIKPYASKAISQMAKKDDTTLNLSIGEPEFGPPSWSIPLVEDILSTADYIKSSKRYEETRGAPELRTAISNWYLRRHGIQIDPEREVLITHGAAEAVTLAILTATNPGDSIAITDPSYSLYERALGMLGRKACIIKRVISEHEYCASESKKHISNALEKSKAIIINSPENPTGYVMSDLDWECLSQLCVRHDKWIIHDEVYSSFAYERPHIPALALRELSSRSVLVNSCSKMLGLPGLRIGWLVAQPRFIEVAAAAHDNLCLGVNILGEHVATAILNDSRLDNWIEQTNKSLENRIRLAMNSLTPESGFFWPRRPMSGIFIFPQITEVLSKFCLTLKSEKSEDAGTVFSKYLLHSKGVASVPGSNYGNSGKRHIRLTTSVSEADYIEAIRRISSIVER